MLEIGSGDGFVASLIAPLGTRLITTDPARGAASHAKELSRVRCSVTSLPFADASFDFIFSSSVLEHVRDRAIAMSELGRCLRPGGVMLHVMPSTTWKFLQLALYYPHVALSGLERIGPSRQLPAPATTTETWRDDGAKIPWWKEAWRGALPQVHGEFNGHIREFVGFRAKTWANAFRDAGFDVHDRVRLPLCSGYGFGLERLRRVGERWGFSAHNAFIMTHAGARPERLAFWQCAS